MPNITTTQSQSTIKTNSNPSKIGTSYRGFASIDQEIERDIAMQWFSSKKSSFSQRNFLLKKEKV